MPNPAAEIYFIAAMFVLIFIISAVAVYVFFRTYKKEKLARENRFEKKAAKKRQKENVQN